MKKLKGMLAILLLLPWLGRSDEPSPKQFYKLDFVVQEVDGVRVVNSRAYSTLAATNSTPCYIRTSSKVTMSLPSGRSEYDIGVTIETKNIQETPSGLELMVSAAIMSLAPDIGTDAIPILRRHQWDSALKITVKNPTIIFSSDDVSTKHKLQLVLTATPIR